MADEHSSEQPVSGFHRASAALIWPSVPANRPGRFVAEILITSGFPTISKQTFQGYSPRATSAMVPSNDAHRRLVKEQWAITLVHRYPANG
jgi:hypothetical protein